MEYLSQEKATEIVTDYITRSDSVVSTQAILDSGAIPCLKGYAVRPGKVSDSIFGSQGTDNPPLNDKQGRPLRIMIRTQRISTHDINRGEIPFKDQVLALNHNYMRRFLESFLGTSQIDVPGLNDNSVVIAAENLTQISLENVLRAYMAKSTTATSLYQHYIKGARTFCGHVLPAGLIANGPLPYVMDTPSTKSDLHDESVTPEQLFESGACTPDQYTAVRNASLCAFGVVAEFLRTKGLIAVDTKTEHGLNSKGKIVSQDEIWTMDSSRFWLADDYATQLQRYRAGDSTEIAPRSYSKEFARDFSKGEEGYTVEQRTKIAVRYIEGVQHLLGQPFVPDTRSWEERVVDGLQRVVEEVVG